MAEGSGIAAGRLKEERKAWRRDHPPSFYARPSRKADGQTDLMKWDCGIPGKAGVRLSDHCSPTTPATPPPRAHTPSQCTHRSLRNARVLALCGSGFRVPFRAPPSQTRAARAIPVPSPPHRGYRGFTSARPSFVRGAHFTSSWLDAERASALSLIRLLL